MKNVTKTNILFTFMAAFYLLVIFVVRLVPTQWLGMNVRMILPEVIMLVPALIYVTFLKPEGLEAISYEVPSPVNTIRIVIATLCMVPFIAVVNSLSTIFVENKVTAVVGGLGTNPLWLNIIVLALIPAVCEEYIFRGLVFNGYRKRNPFGAMLMSSLLFGLIHMNVNQFIYAFIMGCIFCVLVYATGTVVSSMIAHFVFNGFSVIISYVTADMISEGSQASEVQAVSASEYVTAYLVLGILAAAGVFAAYRQFKKVCDSNRGLINVKRMFTKENRKAYREDQGRFFDGYIGVGILLCVVYILLYGL